MPCQSSPRGLFRGRVAGAACFVPLLLTLAATVITGATDEATGQDTDPFATAPRDSGHSASARPPGPASQPAPS